MRKIESVGSDEILARIEGAAPESAPWVFDCDGTLIHGDIASLTAWALLRMGLAHTELLPDEWDEFKVLPFDYPAFLRLRKNIITRRGINAIYEWEAFLHTGLPPNTSTDTAKFAVVEGQKEGHLRFTKNISRLAERVRNNAWICSGSPDMCVWAIADKIGIDRKRALGTRLQTVDGLYAPRLEAPGIVWEELKREVLISKGVEKPYFVAGDTLGDWAMFEMATHWCWVLVWGDKRHRGEEIRNVLAERLLSKHGNPALPTEKGCYLFESPEKKWVFEIL